jgi:hypothetical protein
MPTPHWVAGGEIKSLLNDPGAKVSNFLPTRARKAV